MRPDKNATEANNIQASDSELVDEKIYPLCPSQKAETAVPEYEQIDWEAEQNQGRPERWGKTSSRDTSRHFDHSNANLAFMSRSNRPYGFTCSHINGVRAA